MKEEPPNTPPVPGSRPGARERVVVERAGCRIEDWVVVEEPLEIRINGKPFAVTMRTPGNDDALAAGLLFSEGVIENRNDVVGFEPARSALGISKTKRGPSDAKSTEAGAPAPPRGDRITVELTEAAFDRWARSRIERELIATSACGVCGKPTLEDLWRSSPRRERIRELLTWPRQHIEELVAEMQRSQVLFADTGGAHGAALFDLDGARLLTHEDIGRHNAVDKVIGARLLETGRDLEGHLLVVSGRGGFEIIQKAIAARAAAVISVGAASSLAIELARDAGLELVSFAARGGGNRHLRE